MKSIDSKYDRLIMYVVDSLDFGLSPELDRITADVLSSLVGRLLEIKDFEIKMMSINAELTTELMDEYALMRMVDSFGREDDEVDCDRFEIGLN